MTNVGMILLAIGTVIYMSCELGCGSKDSVTMGLTKKLSKPIKLTRASLEIIAIIIWIFIGGEFSIVTIYSAAIFGYFIQLTFKIFKKNPQKLNHVPILEILKRKEGSIYES